jgi:hypothetical protein
MTNSRIQFRDLRKLLLDLGFKEYSVEGATIFNHRTSDTLFVFRPYRPSDLVKSHNLFEVKDMLDARGLMSADTFDTQFKKAPA